MQPSFTSRWRSLQGEEGKNHRVAAAECVLKEGSDSHIQHVLGSVVRVTAYTKCGSCKADST
jgi:hypothetical protein